MLIVLNAHHEGRGASPCPPSPAARPWRLVFDTNAPNHEDEVAVGEEYVVTGRSVLLFERMVMTAEPERRRRTPRRRGRRGFYRHGVVDRGLKRQFHPDGNHLLRRRSRKYSIGVSPVLPRNR